MSDYFHLLWWLGGNTKGSKQLSSAVVGCVPRKSTRVNRDLTRLHMCETSDWFWICVGMVISILTVLSWRQVPGRPRFGARLDVLEQQVVLCRELSSGAVVSLQAALDCCSSGVTELQDVLVQGLRNDVGLMQAALDSWSSGATLLQDVVLPRLRDDVNRCSSGVDELRLGRVPKLQVDVERYSALSLCGWMIWPIASMMGSARSSATLLRSLRELSSLLKSWEFSLRDHRGLLVAVLWSS